MPTIYIDESGRMDQHYPSEQFFCVASIETEYPELLERQFTAWIRAHFFHKAFRQNEIKFSLYEISPSLRLRTLNFIASLDIRINVVYFANDLIPRKYFDKDGLRSGHLYLDTINEAIRSHAPFSDDYLLVYCDQRPLKRVTQSQFNESVIQHAATFMPPGSIVGSQMVDSTSTVNIQIADWVVGAFAAHINEKPNGHEYWNALAGKALVLRYPFPSRLDGFNITFERERDG